MNFSDEEYVRLYITDTVTWRVLPWEARVTMVLALRKFDKAGVFEFGKHGAEKSLAAAVDLPVEIVTKGIASLVSEEVWEVETGRLFWPRYIEAQNCKRSDRLRQRISRANRNRDTANDSESNRDNTSQNVTGCHDSSQTSQIVTPGRGSGEAREGKGVDSGSDARATVPDVASRRFTESLMSDPPDSLEFTEEHRQIARAGGLDIEECWKECRDYRRGQGQRSANWDASFASWLRNERKRQGSTPKKPDSKPSESLQYPNLTAEVTEQYRRTQALKRQRAREAVLAAQGPEVATGSQSDALDPKAAPQ